MSTSVNSSTSPLMAKTGMAGLVSGLDTDSLVESLTSSNRGKIEKQQQNIQRLEWKQESYRNISKALKEFQSKYLDVLSATNFRSASLYNTIKASTTSSKLSVSATSGAVAGTIKIANVQQLATRQTISGTEGVSKPLTGNVDVTNSGLLDGISGDVSKSFLLKLDGKVRTVTLDAAFAAAAAGSDGFEKAMQDKIDSIFGKKSDNSPIVEVSLTLEGKLGFSSGGSQLTVNALNGDTETLAKLGFTEGQTDRLTTTKSLADLRSSLGVALDGDDFNFSINGKDFSFKSTDTLAAVMSKVNSSGAGVTMAYSSITDKISLTASETGSGENINIAQTTGNLMESLGLLGGKSSTEYGQNAELEINGIAVVRSSNNIEVNGVKIELKEKTAIGEELVINMSTDTTDLKENIKNFVTDYNNLLDMMNGLVKEKADKAFTPLTEAQKSEMSEKEVENWEKKAKSGLLQNDNAVRTITAKMQSMIYGSAVKGGINLFSMGITSTGYTENGKLKIDEEKLQTALETRGDEIKDLFTTENTGLANQLNSIIDSAAKTSGAKGSRGSLIELAGYESTLSSTENRITETITRTNKDIAKLKEMLKKQETHYWSKFSALETALQRLNVQGSMIASFGSDS
ncbi:flagellar filament capping protein FliD [uncultured Acetobacterium sp.]|uniref:flagellar filament capping protein FliD n=1 Tax=uncultured Acetobacterium sp. TaxID=217139 RepID=UPI0025D44D6D|nr:flagellar filament capping protein FliD [uncultured Acetobacterium sp.]